MWLDGVAGAPRRLRGGSVCPQVRGVPWMAPATSGAGPTVPEQHELLGFGLAASGRCEIPAAKRLLKPVLVAPLSAGQHRAEHRHRVARRPDRPDSVQCGQSWFVWDFPWPIQLDRGPWECIRCKMTRAQGADASYCRSFPVTDSDVVRCVPDAVLVRPESDKSKEGPCYPLALRQGPPA